MKRDWRIRNMGLILGVAVCLLPSAAWAQKPEPALVCQPDSGFWQEENGLDVLSGAICTRDQEEGLYRIVFDGEKTVHAFSPTITAQTGKLRSLAAVGETLFYADADHLYAVSDKNDKVTWTRPWAEAVALAKPVGERFAAFLVMEDGGASSVRTLKILTVDHGHVTERLSAPIDITQHLDFVWQPDRLVQVDQARLTWWPRQGMTFESPVSIELAQPLHSDAEYRLDETGMLVINRDKNWIHYYRFDTRTRVTAHLNATASVRGIGGSSTRAMGVTSDLNIVRIVARMGNVLQNRYEAKYWRVKDDAPMILADGETLVLDGGDDNRSQSVDTSAMTWKRMAVMDYSSPGRLALLKGNVLTTCHEGGQYALIRWNVETGTPIARLPFSAFDALGDRSQWPRIERVTPVPTDEGYLVLELNRLTENQRELAFVVLDVKTMKLVPEGKVFYADARVQDLPSSIRLHDGGFSIADRMPAVEWYIFGEGNVRRQRLLDVPTSAAAEQLTAAEKWYGYCYEADQCIVPAKVRPNVEEGNEEARVAAWKPSLTQFQEHTPPVRAWIVALFSLLAMIMITVWRNGGFAKSALRPDDVKEDPFSSTAFEILDDKNRRFVTERDRMSFLTPSFLSQLWFRVLFSIAVGVGAATFTALRFFSDDVPSVFFAWLIILALPVISAVWVIISWSFWNRQYLFRFGRFVEGTWRNCAKPNQSIAYTADNHKTYELSRCQWKRVDFVPIIIYDPNRPSYCSQYTGAVAYALGEKLDHSETRNHACCLDIFRLGMMTLVLAICIASTQIFFKSTYPNPLSIKELNALSSDPQTFLTSCLDACSEDMCFKQCQNRQMRLVYDEAGYALGTDPDITPDTFLKQSHETMTTATEIIEDPTTTCHEKAVRLQAVDMMPVGLSHAFWRVYGQKNMYDLSRIEEGHRFLLKDIGYFQSLCDADGACAREAQACPPPPQCTGSIVQLKQQVCDFARELKIPAIEN